MRSRWIFRLPIFLTIAVMAPLLFSTACASSEPAPDQTADGDELALVWEAWQALQDHYAEPEVLVDGSVAGGPIHRLLQLGDIPPYPFLTDLGRMRGQVPASVPEEMVDVYRATQVYRQANPEVEGADIPQVLVRGLMDGLPDPAAVYLTAEQLPEAREQLESQFQGSYVGIGALVQSQDGQIELTPFESSPAELAGIEPGDLLLAVDGVSVADLMPREVGELIRGEEGTQVKLLLERPGEDEPLELDVFRGNVERSSISRRLFQGGIAYIRIGSFRENTGQQVFDSLESLKQIDMLALILDLRFNPGGSAEAAAEVAGHFLPPGEVFRKVADRDGTLSEHRYAEDSLRLSLDDLMIVVLVDERTTAEAEAVAAALQEAGRATIMGVPTFGEGSTYEFVALSDGSALYIPTSRWYTPSGAWVGDKPVQPDVIVTYDEVPIGPGGEMQFNTAFEYLDRRLPLFR